MGITLRELLELAGGMQPWQAVEVLDARRLVDAAVHRRAPGRAAGLRGGGQERLDERHHRADDLRRRRQRRAGSAEVDCSSTSTSRAASARRAARATTGSPRSWNGSWPGRAPWPTWTPCSTPATTSWAARSAPSVTARPAHHLLHPVLPGRVPRPASRRTRTAASSRTRQP